MTRLEVKLDAICDRLDRIDSKMEQIEKDLRSDAEALRKMQWTGAGIGMALLAVGGALYNKVGSLLARLFS